MSTKRASKPVLIIIPAYNEEQSLGAVLDGLKAPEIAAIADVLVMDDASSDHTDDVARAHGAKCITHVFNLGYGSGLQVGYKYAIREGYQYVIQMDADGQHDVCNVLHIWEKLTQGPAEERPDIVLGSRYMEGSEKYDSGALKRLAYSWFRFLIRRMTGKTIVDPTTGLQGLSRSTLRFYSRYKHFDDKYPDANMLVQMLLLGYRVEQIPAVMHYRTQGTSMHSGVWKPMMYMLRVTLSQIAIWVRIRVMKMDLKEAQALREQEAGK